MFAPKYLENRIKFYPEIKRGGCHRTGPRLRDDVDQYRSCIGGQLGRAQQYRLMRAIRNWPAIPQVYKMIERRIDELNLSLAREPRMVASQIKRFLILHKELDADDGEMTRTQKVRRSFIADRYAPFINALYNGSPRATDQDRGNIRGWPQGHA